MYLSKPIEFTTPTVSPKVHYGFGVITICQCRFISYNKCTPVVRVVDSERGWAHKGAGGRWKIAVPYAPYCCEPKTALKKKSLLKILFFIL